MSEQATAAGTVDPSQVDNSPGTGTGVPANEAQAAQADFDAALSAFRSAMGNEGASKAPAASEKPAAEPKVEDKPATVPASPAAPQAPQSPDLSAVLNRMTQFEDAVKAAEAKNRELQTQLAEYEAVKDNPIELLKKRGWSKERVEKWLTGEDNGATEQESELTVLKRELAEIKADRAESKKQREAREAEDKRSSGERDYKTKVIQPALDAAKYPLLHKAHSAEELTQMVFATALQQYQRTGNEPVIGDVLGALEKSLSTLATKLGVAPAAAAPKKAVAPALSQLASSSNAGTNEAEPEDDAAAFRAAADLAKQFVSQNQ